MSGRMLFNFWPAVLQLFDHVGRETYSRAAAAAMAATRYGYAVTSY